jgi:FtsZ-binding cell division protein ZapB
MKHKVSKELLDYDPIPSIIRELEDVVEYLNVQNRIYEAAILSKDFNHPDIEKIDIEQTIKDLKERNRILTIENEALLKSKNMFSERCKEGNRQLAYWQKRINQNSHSEGTTK